MFFPIRIPPSAILLPFDAPRAWRYRQLTVVSGRYGYMTLKSLGTGDANRSRFLQEPFRTHK